LLVVMKHETFTFHKHRIMTENRLKKRYRVNKAGSEERNGKTNKPPEKIWVRDLWVGRQTWVHVVATRTRHL
jgi:hypothetical protein